MKKKKFNSKNLSLKKKTISKLDYGKVSGGIGPNSTDVICIITGPINGCVINSDECNNPVNTNNGCENGSNGLCANTTGTDTNYCSIGFC